MKKVLLTFAVLAAAAGSAFAQFEQGTILLSGSTNLGFMANSTTVEVDGEKGDGDAAKSSNFGLGTKAGYFFADGIAGGLMLNFGSESADVPTGDGDKTEKVTASSFMVGPWVRYYMEMGLFGELNVGFGGENDGNDDSEDPSLFGWGLNVGYAIMLGDRIALEPSLGYGMTTATTKDDVEIKEKTGSFGVNVGVTVFLGN